MDESTLKRRERLQAMQRANLDSWCGRAPKLDSTGLDTNMKKNTGFIKKCKASMSQDSAAQLLREVNLLKLDKYVSEIVPAAAEGLLRCKTSSDFQAAVDVITALHARFPIHFTASLIRVLLKSLSPPGVAALAAMSSEQREREEQGRLSRQKTLLRVVGEMYLSGLLWGVDSLPGGVDGLDRAAAFTLSHTVQSSGTGGSSSQGKFSAKVRDMVQQPGHCAMLGVLQNLFLSDKEHHLSIILATSFARVFRVEFALTDAEQLENSACAIDAIPPKQGAYEQVVGMESCKKIKFVLHDYLDSAVSHLETMNHTLTQMRRNADEKLFSKGIVHADIKERIEKHTKSFSRLSESVTMLCEALGRTPPHFDDSVGDESQLGIVFDGPGDAASASTRRQYKQWEDEEERSLYESILDLQSLLPPSMLAIRRKKPKDSADGDKDQLPSVGKEVDGSDQPSTEAPADSTGNGSDIGHIDDINEDDIKVDLQPEIGDLDDADDDASEPNSALGLLEYQKYMNQRRYGVDSTDEQPPTSEKPARHAASEVRRGNGESPSYASRATSVEPSDADANKTAPEEAANGAEGTMTVVQQTGSARTVTQTITPMSFATILRRLPALTTKEGADQAALNFCYVNSKANRAALIRTLVEVPRRQQFLIPFYSRFIAVLHPYFPEIGDSVLEELSHEFHWLSKQRFKDLMDTRLKNIKYIAELTKFKVAPLHVSFRCAKTTLEQFHAQNVEVLCALLEGCGRFLLAQSETSDRVASLLTILMRKRRVLNLDERTSLLIDNAYRACNPRQAQAEQIVKYRTPYERYIRKLVYEDLTRGTVDSVTLRLRKLPWSGLSSEDPQRIRHALVSCFSKIWKTKYSNVYLVTMVAGVLGRLHSWFRVAVVDAVMESIKLGLERNMFSHNQRRVAEARYIGEMLIYKFVDTKEVMDLLYLLLSFGHTTPYPLPGRSCEHDLSGDFFRIRLACTILSTCGQYIRGAEDRLALERYGLYLQLYVLAKDQPLPVDIDYSVESVYETVFSDTKRYQTWAEAARAMQELVQGQGSASGGMPVQVATPEEPALNIATPVDMPTDADDNSTIEVDADLANISGVVSAQYPISEDASGNESDEYDEEAHLEALEALLEKEEEDQLECEFNRLMLDSVDTRKTERVSKLEMGIPMNLLGRTPALQTTASSERIFKPDEAGSASDSTVAAAAGEQLADEQGAMKFALLMGKKQRPVVREVNIPIESEIAKKIRLQEETALREKAHLKRFVLNYERREAEEEQRQYERERERLLLAMRNRVSGNSNASASIDSVHRQPPVRVVPGAIYVNKPLAPTSRRRHGSAAPRKPAGQPQGAAPVPKATADGGQR
ncbi:mRNA decay protein [Coemansia aciculifera]|uniref:mRNA decay protein n=1 Tax=Coemansia aciculifera TaxID=417176 RepID=A0A9W8IMB8_9FUNG|nr:mRNA decay protein [Coemansia aciculifera]